MILYILIVTGGVMIYSGVKKTSPLEVIKSVLTNSPIPTKVSTTTVTPESIAANTKKASGEIAGTTNSPGTMGW